MRKSVVVVTLLIAAMVTHATVGHAERAPAARPVPPVPPVLKVGAAARSVLPTVDGTLDYLDDLALDPDDPWSPGLFVE